MRNLVVRLVVASLACLATLVPALALPAEIRAQMHHAEDYHILIVKGKRVAQALERLEGARIVVWQAPLEASGPDEVARVMTWVSGGGTLWFQDSRLASLFGFEAAPASKSEVGVDETVGEYGATLQAKGVPVTGYTASTAELLRGVSSVRIFLLRVAPRTYSAVREAGDVTPLLRLAPSPHDALHDRLAAAMRSVGKGHVIFKPLIYIKELDGERLQANLLEFSAGFGVPR